MKRMIATTFLAAAGSAVALGACGGGASKPSAAAVSAKLKADPELSSTLKELNPSQVNCFTGLIYKYGSASSLSSYVNGKITLDQVKGGGISSSGLQSKAESCVTGSSGNSSSNG